MTGQGESVVILFRGGRLPEWRLLDQAQRSDFERQHVDLMLAVSERHGLIGIHGYRLLGPRGNWERFWTVEFPDLAGAEAWMSAETEPPYGCYGFYDYALARRWRPEELDWLPRKPEPPVAPGTDPHAIPNLAADPSSIVLLAFGRQYRGPNQVAPWESRRREMAANAEGKPKPPPHPRRGLSPDGSQRAWPVGLDSGVPGAVRNRGLDRCGDGAGHWSRSQTRFPSGQTLGAGILHYLAAGTGRLRPVKFHPTYVQV